jgi:UDP-N-acetyl-alpha-D-muramoyl-L-alanyl-L-glutamate epimerase
MTSVAGPPRARRFTYVDVDVDAGRRTITCTYRSDEVSFTELAAFDESVDLSAPGVDEVAALYFLLAGLSYYKTGAALEIDAPSVQLGDAQVALLRGAIRGGLAEFAHRNALTLDDVVLPAGGPLSPAHPAPLTRGPLIPFGGGIDSIVTVATTDAADAALFVVAPGTGRFEAIERPAATTGLPIVRCTRTIDHSLTAASDRRFEGHVPVTAIVSSLALIAAVAQGRAEVLMSNEASSSSPTLVVDGKLVNHQWSKSLECELLVRAAVAECLEPAPSYLSALRTRSELWIAREFSQHPEYFGTFMSCNRAFRQEPSARATTWCGECDKCLFTDLVLAPFIDRSVLEGIFSNAEPLGDATCTDQLEVLVGLSDRPKPFECVGDVDECASALVAAAKRPDRIDQRHLAALASRCRHARPIEEALAHAPSALETVDAARDLL